MRRVSLVIVFALVACKSEPSFDERFEETREAVNAKARELDSEILSGQDGLTGLDDGSECMVDQTNEERSKACVATSE